jgi:hypothetical protein
VMNPRFFASKRIPRVPIACNPKLSATLRASLSSNNIRCSPVSSAKAIASRSPSSNSGDILLAMIDITHTCNQIEFIACNTNSVPGKPSIVTSL